MTDHISGGRVIDLWIFEKIQEGDLVIYIILWLLWNFDMRGEYKYIVLYEIIRNFMLNVDSRGNCISLVSKWHYLLELSQMVIEI
jgi:hypothetical protein